MSELEYKAPEAKPLRRSVVRFLKKRVSCGLSSAGIARLRLNKELKRQSVEDAMIEALVESNNNIPLAGYFK